MKYCNTLPHWYKVKAISIIEENETVLGEKIVSTFFGIEQFLMEHKTKIGFVEPVQKINNEYIVVEGRSKNLYRGLYHLSGN